MKILISGGHLTPALALIDYLKSQDQKYEIVFVGRLFSQSKLKQLAQEKKEITQRKIKFIHLNAAKTPQSNSLLISLKSSILLIRSIFSSLNIFIKEKPNVFVSFGGYLAIPLAVAAKLTNTPIITHEQTHAAGFANQIIAKFANKIAISYPTSMAYFPRNKTVLTGNPIRSEILKKSSPQPSWVKNKLNKPILLVAGGNQGSQIINQVIEASLLHLTKEWTVVHLCGSSTYSFNYKDQLQAALEKLPPDQQKNYYIQEWISGQDMTWIYSHAQAAISRAGANTTMELTLKNIPTIFIPLPKAHHNEQLKNAQSLEKQRAALLLTQENFSSKSLMTKLNQLKADREDIVNNLKQVKITTNANQNLYKLITSLAPHAA